MFKAPHRHSRASGNLAFDDWVPAFAGMTNGVGKSSRRFTVAKPFVNPRRGRYGPAQLMKIHPLITKSDDLAKLVERLATEPFIAVDTEFMRENTYWPDLCLIQVASSSEAAAIDPKADLDLQPLLDLFVEDEE